MAAKPNVNSEDDWSDATTVSEGAPTMVQLDALGDVFVGVYRGHETITDPNEPDPEKNHWERYNFTGAYTVEAGKTDYGITGDNCAINGNWDLDRQLVKVPEGHLVRIELVKFVKTKQVTPMKSYKVQHKPA